MNFNTKKVMELCNKVVDETNSLASTKEIKEYINVLRLAGSKICREDLKIFTENCPEEYDALIYTLEQLMAVADDEEVNIDAKEMDFYCKLAKAYQKNNKVFDTPSEKKL